ncbi:MAG: helix-turn-helix transcriptional regulator [Tannerella sp.]|jgi:AraC-like DNA-binding protein|nr:helix-turn-helix transcriptional regulator [Tannerella sp.]
MTDKKIVFSQLQDHLESLREWLVAYETFQDDVLYVEFDRSRFRTTDSKENIPAPSRFDALMFLGVLGGDVQVSVDYVTHRVPANGILWIMPAYISQVTNLSPDFRCWILLLSGSFVNDLFHSTANINIVSFMRLKKHPFSVFSPDEYRLLNRSLQAVRDRILQQTHIFQKEVLIHTVRNFLLDMGNFFMVKNENLFSPVLTRKEEVTESFLKLLSTHCKDQHEVSFYAEKLCITPQYLSLSLKQQTGRSASQWIQDALMVEAKGMLKSHRFSVQEVADMLNFPDQSTFGKFFKKHAGLSPVAFKKL